MTVQAVRIGRSGTGQTWRRQRATEEAKRASEEAATAKSVSDFLEGMFKVADPAESRGATITAKEILDRGAARIEKELADQPIVQMRLVNTMFRVYDRLGLFEEGKRLVEAMQPLIERYPDRIESADLLGWLVWTQPGKARRDRPGDAFAPDPRAHTSPYRPQDRARLLLPGPGKL